MERKRWITVRVKIIFLLLICSSLIFCASTQKKIVEKQQKDFLELFKYGLFYLNTGNIDEALEHLKKALSLNPQHHLVLNAIGLAHYLKGNLDEALGYFQKCLEINPNFTEAHTNIGTTYLKMGFIDKAEEEYQKVLLDKAYSSKELPCYNLAKLYYTQDKLEEAFDYVSKAIKENNRFGAAYNLKGLILEKLKDLPEAVKSYERAVKIVPEEINFSFNLAVALFKNGDYNKAKEIFVKISSEVTDPEIKEKIDKYLKLIEKK